MRTVHRKFPSFYFCMACISLVVVLVGFAKTFFIPVARREFHAPAIIHIHGAFAFAWVLLFLAQSGLINRRMIGVHMKLGLAGLFVAIGVLLTMIPAGVHVVKRDLGQGVGEAAYSSLTGIVSSGCIFLTLVILGIINRRRPELHKRFMLLATIVVLWPAWFRFRHYFPTVPRPDIWFAVVLADSLILVAWVWDRIRNKQIHPVLLYGGLCIIIEQSFEVIVYDSLPWRQVSKGLFEFFGYFV